MRHRSVIYIAGGDFMIYVALGDSITAQRSGVVGYCQLLEDRVNELSISKLVNSGIGSLDTNGLLKRFDELCLVWRPQLVTLMIGANDHVIDPNQDQPRVPLAQYEANLRTMIQSITHLEHGQNFNHGRSQLILMTPPYIATCKKGEADLNEARLLDYCYVVKKLCLEYNLLCVDIHEITAAAAQWDEQIWTKEFTQNQDGVHPSSTIHEIISTHVFTALKQVIEQDAK
jgi:lysophospholipase L1-like esterase